MSVSALLSGDQGHLQVSGLLVRLVRGNNVKNDTMSLPETSRKLGGGKEGDVYDEDPFRRHFRDCAARAIL